MAAALPTNARWLDPIGYCLGCKKQAVGILMSDRNDKLGAYCRRCADAAISNYGKGRP